MDTISALLAINEGNQPINYDFPAQKGHQYETLMTSFLLVEKRSVEETTKCLWFEKLRRLM